MKTKYCNSNYFVTQIFPSYIYLQKFIEKCMKKKILHFKLFKWYYKKCFLIIFSIWIKIVKNYLKNLLRFTEKFMKTKYCNSNYFVTQIFPSYIYLQKFIEKCMKKKILHFKLFKWYYKKCFLIIFSIWIKIVKNYLKKFIILSYTHTKKTKKNFTKKHGKGTQVSQQKKKEKGKKRLGTDIKISLRKTKKKNVNIIGVEIRIFLKKTNKRKLSIWEIII